MHCKHACATHAVEGSEFAGFENDFQVRITAGFLDRGNFVEHVSVFTLQECATRDDHIDFVGTFLDGQARLLEFNLPRRHAARK